MFVWTKQRKYIINQTSY